MIERQDECMTKQQSKYIEDKQCCGMRSAKGYSKRVSVRSSHAKLGYEIKVPTRALPQVFQQWCFSDIDHRDVPQSCKR